MRTLLSHSPPSGSWEEVFEHVADKVIQQKGRLRKDDKHGKHAEARMADSSIFAVSRLDLKKPARNFKSIRAWISRQNGQDQPGLAKLIFEL